MLAVRYVKPGVNYRAAIDKWLSVQRDDVVYIFVQFLHVPLGLAPRVYVARPPEIAVQLKAQCSERGPGSLQENTPRDSPRSKYKDMVPPFWSYSIGRIDSI